MKSMIYAANIIKIDIDQSRNINNILTGWRIELIPLIINAICKHRGAKKVAKTSRLVRIARKRRIYTWDR